MQIAFSFVDEITDDEIDTETRYWNHRGYQDVEARILNQPEGGKRIVWTGTREGDCTCELEGFCAVCR